MASYGTSYSAGVLTAFMICLLTWTNALPLWTIEDCMFMAFNATIEFDVEGSEERNIFIPINPNTDGDCDRNGNFSLFALDFVTDNGHEVNVALLFDRNGPDWKMSEVIVDIKSPNKIDSNMKRTVVEDDMFTVPFGYYLNCSWEEEKEEEIHDSGFTFTSIQVMQPFAIDGDLGNEYACIDDDRPERLSNIGLIVGCVLGGMSVLFFACLIANRVRARKSREREYQR